MFGTLGFSELIIILVIVLIIFGAGRLPQIGEGVGKALKGFKKEVQEVPPPVEPEANIAATAPSEGQIASPSQPPEATQGGQTGQGLQQPYQPGTEQTPGTTAALAYSGLRPEPVQAAQPSSSGAVAQGASPRPSAVPPPITMEERSATSIPQTQGQYPPVPQMAKSKPGAKRPSAIVNKDAVARVQAQRAAMQANAAKSGGAGASEDLQSLGEGLGSALRTFRQATADVRNSIDPEMRTIQAELDAAQKEVEQSIEAAKQPPLPKDPSTTT